MQRELRAFLLDILDAASRVQLFLLGVSFELYCELDEKRMAVERGFELMGEAAAQARKIDPELDRLLPEAHQMIALRNILIHNYAAVHDQTVWETAKRDLSPLIVRLEELLAEETTE